MQLSEWSERATALLGDHGAAPPALVQEDLRQALWQAHSLVCDAPNVVLQSFRDLPEAELVEASRRCLDAITGPVAAAPEPPPHTIHALALATGAHVRALDELLLTSARSNGPVSHPDVWLTRDGSAYVLPRYRGSRPEERGRDGRAYSRRGLLYHRILPAELRGYRVVLTLHGDVARDQVGQASERSMGAALLPGLTLAHVDVGGGFRIEDVICAGARDVVVRQVDSARADGCYAVVWPELTIPGELRQAIAGKLREGVMEPHGFSELQVVVAGTWHEPQADGSYKNVGSVLDGYGRLKLRFEKLLPFPDKELGREAIAYGEELQVLVTDEHLIAFAICRDFCDLSMDLPYPELDVDLVVVPSYGTEKTMTAHRGTAAKIRVLYGAHTFVVQQCEYSPTVPDELGWVLACPIDPHAGELSELRQNVDWRTYPWGTTFHSG